MTTENRKSNRRRRAELIALILTLACATAHAQDGYEAADNTYTGATALAMDTLVTDHTLHSATDVDYLKFTVTETNHAYYLELTGLMDQFVTIYANLALYNTNGVDVLTAVSNEYGASSIAIWYYPLATAGVYYVAASNTALGNSGPYNVRVRDYHNYEPDDTLAAASNIAATGVAQANRAFHNDTDIDFAQFSATAGRYYGIAMTDHQLGAILSLYDTNRTTVLMALTNDPNSAVYNLDLGYAITTTGVYYVKVESSTTMQQGFYALTVTDYGAGDSYEPDNDYFPVASNLTVGASQWHSFHTPQDADIAWFTNAADHVYQVALTDATVLAYIQLLDWQTNLLAAEDMQFGDGVFEYLFTAAGSNYVGIFPSYASTGGYYLAVTDLGYAPGDRFEKDNTVATASNITADVAQTNRSVHWSGDGDYIRFVAADYHTYRITVTNVAPTLDAYLMRYAANGVTQLATANAAPTGGVETLDAVFYAGTTNFFWVTCDSGTGAYDIVVTDLGALTNDAYGSDDTAATAVTLVPGSTQTDRTIYGTNDADWIKFTVPVAPCYYRVATSNLTGGLNTYLSLYGTNGVDVLASDDNGGGGYASRIEYRIPAPGTYYARVTSSSNYTAGGYALTVADQRIRHQWSLSNWIQSSPALDSNGVAYVGTGDGKVFALADDGSTQRVWTLGGTIYASPALGSDGTVYIGTMSSNLFALNPNGTTNWVRQVAGQMVGSPAVAADGTIYVRTYLHRLYAFSPAGATNWVAVTPGSVASLIDSSPSVASNGTIYVGSNSNRLYAIAPNGTTNWSAMLFGEGDASPAIGAGGKVYIASSVSNLYELNADGTTNRIWVLDGYSGWSSPVLDPNGNIYQAMYTWSGGVYTGRVYSLNPNGTTNWMMWATNMINSTPAIGADGTVYIGGHNRFYALNPNGTTNFLWEMGDGIKSSPAIGTNGLVYVGGTYDNKLYALYGTSYGTNGLADSPWPMFGQNIRNTRSLKPPVASAMTASDGLATNLVRLAWSAATNATAYEIWRHTATNPAAASFLAATGAMQYDDTTPSAGIPYTYWVKAKNNAGVSGFSAGDTGYSLFTAPGALAASDGTYTSKVAVSWAASANASGYTVYRHTGADASQAALLAATATNYYYDAAATPGVIYTYWVMATNSVATGVWSAVETGYRRLTPPEGVSATDGTWTNAIQVSWSAHAQAHWYDVWRGTTADTNAAAWLASVTNATSYTDTNIVPLATNYYWVLARSTGTMASACGAPDTGWAASTNVAPVAPTGLSASDGDATGQVSLIWTPVATATGYEIYRHTAGVTSGAVLLGTSAGAVYDDTTAQPGAIYYYWVKATNAAGSSGFSAADTGYRLLSAPTGVSATDGTLTGRVVVAWTGVTGAEWYEVYRGASYDASATAALASVWGAASYDDAAATATQTNWYWVRARSTGTTASAASAGDAGWAAGSASATNASASTNTTSVAPPAPPARVWAGDGLSTQAIRVVWTAVTNATQYQVWRSTFNATGTAAVVQSVASNDYEDVAVVPGTTYYYWVRAENAGGLGAFSDPDSGYAASGTNAADATQADLALGEFLFLPAALSAGGHPDGIALVLINNGPAALEGSNGWVQFDFYLSDDTTDGGADDLWLGDYRTHMTLAAGGYATVIVAADSLAGITAPTAAAGNYYVLARVRPASPSALADTNLANNVSVRTGTLAVEAEGWGLPAMGDFDGDGKTDLALYQENGGVWVVRLSGSGYALVALDFGGAGYRPVVADFDGDGRDDLTVFDPVTATWYRRLSGSGYAMSAIPVAGFGYEPLAGDFDGDGRADLVLYQEATGLWHVRASVTGEWTSRSFGDDGYAPLAGDYDGDGLADYMLFHAATDAWFGRLSGSGYGLVAAVFDGCGEEPLRGDYDGDGRTDVGGYEAATGAWSLWLSSDGFATPIRFVLGGADYTVAEADYDGDGKTDPAIFDPAAGAWAVLLSSAAYALYAVAF